MSGIYEESQNQSQSGYEYISLNPNNKSRPKITNEPISVQLPISGFFSIIWSGTFKANSQVATIILRKKPVVMNERPHLKRSISSKPLGTRRIPIPITRTRLELLVNKSFRNLYSWFFSPSVNTILTSPCCSVFIKITSSLAPPQPAAVGGGWVREIPSPQMTLNFDFDGKDESDGTSDIPHHAAIKPCRFSAPITPASHHLLMEERWKQEQEVGT